MGGPDRQGRARAVSQRPPQPGMAQAEDAAAAGVHRRRLDGAAIDAPVLRRVAAWRARREASGGAHLRRAYRHRVQPGGAGTRLEAARGQGNRPIAVRGPDQVQRAGALGAPGARRAGAVHGMDRRRQAAPSCLPRASGRQAGGGRGAREEDEARAPPSARRGRRRCHRRRWRP